MLDTSCWLSGVGAAAAGEAPTTAGTGVRAAATPVGLEAASGVLAADVAGAAATAAGATGSDRRYATRLVRSLSLTWSGPKAGMPSRPAQTRATMAASSGYRCVKAAPFNAGPMPAFPFGWQPLHFA